MISLFTTGLLGLFIFILIADEKSKSINAIIPYEKRVRIKENLLLFKTISNQRKTIESLRFSNSNQGKYNKIKAFNRYRIRKKRDSTNIFTTLKSEIDEQYDSSKYKLTSGFIQI